MDKKPLYVASSFLAGFSIMVVELISSRIVAPIIGASVYTWTSVIGLTLLGLALGGWAGGKIADTIKTEKPLPLAFLSSAIFIALIPKLAEHTDTLTNASTSLLFLNLFLSFYLFFIPACAVGTIQPLLLKKYADSFSNIGSRYGILSAAWSIGSMFGVFLTGFFFISTIGSTETIWLVSLILFLLGIYYSLSDTKLLLIFLISTSVLLILFYLTQPHTNKVVLFEKETDYYSTKVVDATDPSFGKSRILLLDMDVHSIMSEGTSSTKIYTDMQPVFSYLKNDIQNILVLGAGAYTLPKHFKEFYKDSHVTVVEIDPEMVSIANTYFDLGKYNISTEVNDAKLFIRKTNKSYDLIFGDTFNSYISVPWHLLTKEWGAEVRGKLNKNGIYAINFIGPLTGEGSEFTKSVSRTFKQSFPNYYIFSFSPNKSDVQNIVLVGINGDLPIDEKELIKKLQNDNHKQLARTVTARTFLNDSNALILTDNYSPVERLMTPIITKYFPTNLDFIHKLLSGAIVI